MSSKYRVSITQPFPYLPRRLRKEWVTCIRPSPYSAVTEVEDDRHVPQAPFVSNDSLVEGEAAAVDTVILVKGFFNRLSPF
jgi:hypothetical protein